MCPPAPLAKGWAGGRQKDMAEFLETDILAAKTGDTQALGRLLDKYSPRVAAVVGRHVPAAEAAEVVQEVFVKVAAKIGTFRGEAPFEHWLSAVATRTCLSFWRSHNRRRVLPEAEFMEAGDDPGLSLVEAMVDPSACVEDEVFVAQARRLLDQALMELSPEARMILTLTEFEDRPDKEASELLGMSVVAIKVARHRAKKKLRTILTRMGLNKEDLP